MNLEDRQKSLSNTPTAEWGQWVSSFLLGLYDDFGGYRIVGFQAPQFDLDSLHLYGVKDHLEHLPITLGPTLGIVLSR